MHTTLCRATPGRGPREPVVSPAPPARRGVAESEAASAEDRAGDPAIRRLALVTDAWHPQRNGVVNTLSRVAEYLRCQGLEVLLLTPEGHRVVPLPSYPEIQVACDPWKVVARLQSVRPDAVHLATEGPLGLWARGWLGWRGLPYTTSFHTRFPEYLKARLPVPLAWSYRLVRWFHGGAVSTLVGTQSLIRELADRGVGRRLVHWPRGVDTDAFRPDRRRSDTYPGARPAWLYVGRVAVEKNLEDFLALPLPGTKVVVGDGPARADLERRFPSVLWRGWRFGDDLATHFASADCFVFPSRTETFGNVILEALASGLPVASVPASGPADLVREGVNGALDDDLGAACQRALRCSRHDARASALRYEWRASHERFRSCLVPLARGRAVPRTGVS